MPSDVAKSKFLSRILRHDPGAVGLALDPQGWALIDDVVEKSVASKALNREDIFRIAAQSDKQRFAIDPERQRIRANQGHSIPVALGLGACVPPEVLFHGTASRFIDSIRTQGLVKGARHHVHLTPSPDVARNVGARHGKPVLLRIDSARMHQAGCVFYLSENGVWLTESVPPDCLEVVAPGG